MFHAVSLALELVPTGSAGLLSGLDLWRRAAPRIDFFLMNGLLHRVVALQNRFPIKHPQQATNNFLAKCGAKRVVQPSARWP